MIGYRIPLFQEGDILTKDMLECMKMFQVNFAKMSYAGFSDGILTGGHVIGDIDKVILQRCMIKYKDNIIFIPDDIQIMLDKTSDEQSVKIVLGDYEITPEYEQVMYDVVSNTKLEKEDNIIEICRIKMQSGAKLRYEYKDFEDVNTSYNTVNLVESDWAGYGQKSLNPQILREFNKEASLIDNKETIDHIFLMQIANMQEGTVQRSLINYYINERLGQNEESRTNKELFEGLRDILSLMKNGRKNRIEKKTSQRIIID